MIKLEFDEKSVNMLLKRADGISPKDQGKAVYKGFVRASLLIERALKGNLSGSYLNVRTGRLRSSIGSRVEVDGNGLKAVIGSGARQGERVPYANIHETGGTIRPRVRQFLTVPLDAAKTASGGPRFSAQDVRSGATKYSGSFVYEGIIYGYIKRGSYKSGGGKLKIDALFVLKTSVTLPASRYLTRTAVETFKDANREILETVKEGLQQ